MKLLNVAAGKMPHLNDLLNRKDVENLFIVNLDTMYYNHTNEGIIEQDYHLWRENTTETYYCKADIFEFLEKTQMIFDVVTIYRFLEHVSFTNILYFIYLLSTCIREGGIVDVIVPNYELLAQMILDESVQDREFEKNNILLTTELLNEPSCPHASIWTPQRAEYFWEYEGRFRIHDDKVDPHFVYDGRNIYLRFQAERT